MVEKKFSQSVSQSDAVYALTLAQDNPRVTLRAVYRKPLPLSLRWYIHVRARSRCNVNWNYTCVVTRERLILRAGRGMMYASCRAIRAEVDKDGPSSHSKDHLRPGYHFAKERSSSARRESRALFPRTPLDTNHYPTAPWDRISSRIRCETIRARCSH